MSSDEILREKLKQMPHFTPHTDRETLRRQVLAEVEKRERRVRKPRKVLLPTAFAAALAVFMFVVLSPWLSQKATDDGVQISLMYSNSGNSGAEMSPVPEGSNVPAADIEQDEALNPGDSAESENEENGSDVQPFEEQSPARGVREPQENGEIPALSVRHIGTVKRVVNIEGFRENTVFSNYIFEPYGLRILIPETNDGARWFDGPLIDGQSVVFESRLDTLENGQLQLSSITVTAHDDQTLEEVIEDEIATENENAKEIGYKAEPMKVRLANGERVIFTRALEDNDGREYTYYREVFVTEQDGSTFSFHIGRNAETSDGFSPRLEEVVYPEFKIVN